MDTYTYTHIHICGLLYTWYPVLPRFRSRHESLSTQHLVLHPHTFLTYLRNKHGCKHTHAHTNTVNEQNPPGQLCSDDLWIWLPTFRRLTIWLVFNAFSFFLIGTAKHVMFLLPVGNATKASHKNLHLCNKLLYNLLLMNKVPENVQPFCTLNTKQMEVWK